MKGAAVVVVILAAIVSAVFGVAALWTLPEPSRSYALLSLAFSIASALVAWLVDE